MPIISKETWDKFTQEEKEKIRSIYSEAKKVGTRNIRELEEYFGKENLQATPLTYEDVAKIVEDSDIRDLSNKYHAIWKLLVVAKFLNGSWKPDWNNIQDRWYLAIEDGKIKVDYNDDIHNSHIVYFPTKELAEQAIQILGEYTVIVALTTEY